jgi:ubiquitin carboxyl-terminal hydrolase L3
MFEEAYASVASKGDTEAPDAEDEVDYHYICFVKSHNSGRLYQMDGDRKQPINLGELGEKEDLLSDKCLDIIRKMVTQEEGAQMGANLIALVSA